MKAKKRLAVVHLQYVLKLASMRTASVCVCACTYACALPCAFIPFPPFVAGGYNHSRWSVRGARKELKTLCVALWIRRRHGAGQLGSWWPTSSPCTRLHEYAWGHHMSQPHAQVPRMEQPRIQAVRITFRHKLVPDNAPMPMTASLAVSPTRSGLPQCGSEA